MLPRRANILSDDDLLLAKVLDTVRYEVVCPLVVQVSKVMNGKVTDTHVFEIPVGASVLDVQKEVQSVVLKWKGGYPIGTRYVMERLGSVPKGD